MFFFHLKEKYYKESAEETIKRLTLIYVMSCNLPVHRIVIGI